VDSSRFIRLTNNGVLAQLAKRQEMVVMKKEGISLCDSHDVVEDVLERGISDSMNFELKREIIAR
jgi:hypothetical protein